MSSVAIVVATHKIYPSLDLCIEGHLALVENPEDLILVDNGSQGAVTQWAKEREYPITLVIRETNGHYCAGYNAGLRHALRKKYLYALIVNADTRVVNTGYLDHLVSVAEHQRDGAFFGPRVKAEGRVQNTILPFPWFFGYMFRWMFARQNSGCRSADVTKVTDVEFLNGVCVLCRLDALSDFGLLDENMGGYVEDADWSWRAQLKGWRSVFVPVDSIEHDQDSDEYQHFSEKVFMLRRNHVYWHAKNKRRLQAMLFFLVPACLAFGRALISTRSEARPLFWSYLRRFLRAGSGILVGRPLGPWFGPPLG